MTRSIVALAVALGAVGALGGAKLAFTRSGSPPPDAWLTQPGPQLTTVSAKPGTEDVAVLSGGCFWGMQTVFEHVRGVINVTSGYAGGPEGAASYEMVSEGTTGHAESVRIRFDPSQVTYAQLLQVFMTVAHDPTQLNRQGPDVGTQYRSAIWYNTPEQERVARSYIEQLTNAKVFPRPIVTEVNAFHGFYPAEGYHQDYAEHHPDDLYIVINDRPKVERLKRALPALWREMPVAYAAHAGEP